MGRGSSKRSTLAFTEVLTQASPITEVLESMEQAAHALDDESRSYVNYGKVTDAQYATIRAEEMRDTAASIRGRAEVLRAAFLTGTAVKDVVGQALTYALAASSVAVEDAARSNLKSWPELVAWESVIKVLKATSSSLVGEG